MEATATALLAHRHGSVSSHVESVAPAHRGLLISGSFEDERGRCGSFRCHLWLEERSKGRAARLCAQHSECSLTPRARGSEFGRTWMRGCLKRYERFGVGRVLIHAHGPIGGYVWAPDFEPCQGMESVACICGQRQGSLRHMRRMGRVTDVECEEVRQAFEGGRLRSPRDILALGAKQTWCDERGHTWWVGKRLLAGSSWDGEVAFAQG